ncbi:MAG TPA: hypothetical protein VMK84_12905 [Streptosporangiaceae bacterium]|nr:hypothetical protein [Streptosporangiaceae bacterium]
MSKHGPVRAFLTGAAMVAAVGCALAGCGGVPKGSRPDVPGESMAGSSSGASATTRASGTASAATGPGATAKGFAQANSIPFPVAVGNTWIYQTSAGGQTGRTTNKIVAAAPGSNGYRVTVSSTTDVGRSASSVAPVYTFYLDGTIGYPVPPVSGVPLTGSSVRWPDAAGLASGKAYHSVQRIQGVDADVTVQGAGTTSVSVPAGSYRASVVKTIITAQGQTVEVTVWIAQGTGPVKTAVVIRAPGGTGLTTSELLSFTKAVSVIGDDS